MMKFVVLIFAVICFVHANPIADGWDSNGSQGTNFGNWPQVPQIQWPRIQPPRIITPQEIENMKTVPGATVNGMSQSMSSHTEYVDGKPVNKVEGQTVWNRNGEVEKQSFGN